MNYFTPELLARFGSPDDNVADAAQEEWEQLHAAYLKRLQSIRQQLPKGSRRLLHFNLHDARVLFLGSSKDARSLSMVLQLAARPEEGLQLTYKVAKPVTVLRHPAAEDQPPGLYWLYDELDVVKDEAYPLGKHSILFTGGHELELVFYDLAVKPFRILLTPLETSAAAETGGA